ncbi:MAG: hypothetical protein CVU97_00440 [Firmicutes bacterium HGW-Firmicutes-21]|nr:MAG: hypothetical protein CVU97_00440 [Firmicutes bacterium HGW-Firmicutes-21]
MIHQTNTETRYIYVAFLTAPTRIGRTIRFVTKNKYSHVAISFDENLRTMYSFARYCINDPLVAGFVEESALRYYYNNPDDVPVKICKIPLTAEQHHLVEEYIASIRADSDQYIYNFFALAIAPLHKKILIEKSYTCLEFVYSVLYNCGIETGIDYSSYYTINDLENVLDKYFVHEGLMKKPDDNTDWGNDLFYYRKSVVKIVSGSIKRCGALIKRSIIS